MPDTLSTQTLDDLTKDGHEYDTTVFQYGDASIRRIVKNDISILSISGIYNRNLGKEIERLALHCKTSLGIEFTNIAPHPATRKRFDSSVMGVLRTVRDAYRDRGRQLILYSPPSDLVDLLKLAGAYEGYQVVDQQQPSVPVSVPPASHAAPASPPLPVAPAGAPAVLKKIVQLNQSLKRTESLEKSLDSAARCIEWFLPSVPPASPGYEIAFSYHSSEKVGGDFFDFIPIEDDLLGIVVGDVSGHGLDAAILMGIAKKVISIRAQDMRPPSPREVLVKANADLACDFRKSNFVTALYGTLHLPTGTFTCVRAGHEMPMVFGPGQEPAVVSSKGCPLGSASKKVFSSALEEKAVGLPKGGYLLLLTDGVAECWSPRGAAYSRERILYTLRHIRPTVTAQEALEALFASVRQFQAGRLQEDDMTGVVVRRLPG
ncbi:MAG: SpoIIE family protein phosphatase [Planctomycetes bacterium]|nr:SpoIIE family protein phosphatase [Planctomycetota bacterium]